VGSEDKGLYWKCRRTSEDEKIQEKSKRGIFGKKKTLGRGFTKAVLKKPLR